MGENSISDGSQICSRALENSIVKMLDPQFDGFHGSKDLKFLGIKSNSNMKD